MRGGWLAVAGMAALAAAGEAGAIELDRLLMPGPVIAAHARWESECGSCHRPLDPGGQDALCLDCHDEIAGDRKAARGFHGRAPSVEAAGACRACHGEHRGRDADVVGLVADTFEHRFTDFPLEGGHRAVPCRSCHPPDRRHREAAGDCVACHREDDPHGETLSDDCADCHETASWSRARFDHDRTDFPLRGAHRKVACALCHPDGGHSPAPSGACGDCHRVDDVHRGRLGTDCASCHGVERWEEARFDHARETGFALEGGHAQASCSSCHVEPPADVKLSRECVTCHQSQDVHAGRNGRDCGTCHDALDWAHVRFDHARDAGFALLGAHASLRCTQCHGASLQGMPSKPACADCHRQDDVHGGSLEQRCDLCHGNGSWSAGILFDHDLVRFPLLGLHATAPCEQCHASRRFEHADPACRACHAAEDVHRGALGSDCQRCHGPNGWAVWEFDHDVETSFPLHGAHEDLACASCHQGQGSIAMGSSGRCATCHLDDDAHFGAFGQSCELCHVDDDWKVVLPEHRGR